MKPNLAIATICRNEERDLPRMLRSVAPLNAALYIVDTGSTDNTVDIARSFMAHVRTYTEASRQNEKGEWQLWDFAKARNEVLADVYNQAHLGISHVMWMDADDVLITPDAIRRGLYNECWDCYGVWIDGGTRWIQHRIFRTDKRVFFKGRCHEYAILDNLRCAVLDEALIMHHADPNPGETSNERNLRILIEEWKDEPTPRTAFYIANTHRDAGRYEEAATWYTKRMVMGAEFRDEWLFTILYGARSFRFIKYWKEAAAWCRRGIEAAPDWAEFRMELGFVLYDQKLYDQVIATVTPCMEMKPMRTVLWREPGAYNDQPARLISWCYENMDHIREALIWAEEAQRRIGKPDADWDARVARLRNSMSSFMDVSTVHDPTPVYTKINGGKMKLEPICLNRPGAIGDILMTLNLIPALKEANPGREVWYFCDEKLAEPCALGSTILAAGCDKILPSSQFEKESKDAQRAINLVGYPIWEGYPEKPMTTHLLHYFAHELGLRFDSLPSLALPRPERQFKIDDRPYVTYQIKAGWSKYKQWPEERWEAVMAALPEIHFLSIDAGVHSGAPLSYAINLLANARMHIGIDSFCNHLTNYRWYTPGDFVNEPRRIPGVILWGSTQVSAAGYPHNTNISKGLSCQPCFRENPAISKMPRGPCITVMDPKLITTKAASYDDPRPHACMDSIIVDEVVEAIRAMWEKTK